MIYFQTFIGSCFPVIQSGTGMSLQMRSILISIIQQHSTFLWKTLKVTENRRIIRLARRT